MPPAVLYPHFDHHAIEERYASWQTEMLLRRHHPVLIHYNSDGIAGEAVEDLDAEHVLVICDPLLLPSADLGERLRTVLLDSGVFAALPVTNETSNPKQKTITTAYLTLREFETETEALRRAQPSTERVIWDRSNPAAFVCATASLRGIRETMEHVLTDREVIISRNDYVHRWRSLRGETRNDLLARISTEAKSILEIGCGEARLGEALKKRQKCRVVGIELDRHAAAVAKKRIDDVYCGDVREVVSLVQERFEWIVGGDVVEHLDEPWSFLSDLRRVTSVGGHLLLSIPNIANTAIIGDLLEGRFDYVYMGLSCVGHLRFFTRRSIEELLTIAGWQIVEITPQESPDIPRHETLLNRLRDAGLTLSIDDLAPVGYLVVARNLE